MQVADLIAKLQTMPPWTKVYISACNDSGDYATDVVRVQKTTRRR